MPIWRSSTVEIQRGIVIPLIIFVFAGSYLFNSVDNFRIDRNGSIFNLIISVFFFIFLLGRLYGEIFISKDFVEITKEGIIFRETPAFGMGWLPRNVSVTFDAIGSVDMIQVSTFFHPERKSDALLLRLKSSKQMILGSKLSKDQQLKILLGLKGSVTFSNAIRHLLGTDTEIKDTIQQAMSFAKGIWNKMQENK